MLQLSRFSSILFFRSSFLCSHSLVLLWFTGAALADLANDFFTFPILYGTSLYLTLCYGSQLVTNHSEPS